MKKKKYVIPDLDLMAFRLDKNILLGSIEHGQTSSAIGGMDDPPSSDGPLTIGGLLD